MSRFLVRGRFVLTMAGLPAPHERDRTPGAVLDGVVEHGAVLVDDGRIVQVGPYAELRRAAPEVPVHGDGTGVVLPGLVSVHTHLSEGLVTGMGSELSLFEWGAAIVGPVGRVLTREMAFEGAALRAVEMLQSGVTTVNDMFCHANPGSYASLGAVDALRRAGMRAVVSFGAEDLLLEPGRADRTRVVDALLEEHHALAAHVHDDELIGFRYGIGTLLGQSDALLHEGVRHCHEAGWKVHTHLAEVREELTAAQQRWGRRTIRHARRLGLLDLDPVVAHLVWTTEDDVAVLARHPVGVAHAPVANMILGSGVCPVQRFRMAGVPVGIGTDGAASNDSQDMLGALKTAALLQKLHHLDPRVIDALDVLAMATIEGARVLGLDRLVGSLEVGKRADVVLLQDTVEVAVLHDPVAQVVYGTSPRSVRDVWVDGRHVVVDHRCRTICELDQIQRCRPLVERVARDAGLLDAGHSVAGRTGP